MTVQQALTEFQSEIQKLNYFKLRSSESVTVLNGIKGIAASIAEKHTGTLTGAVSPKKSGTKSKAAAALAAKA